VDRIALADFLRRHREALRPEDVGLPTGARRRASGLRREEVASLAAMSTNYYTRLEQRRASQPSEQMLAPLARALRLTSDERDYRVRTAGRNPPPPTAVSAHVGAGTAAGPGPVVGHAGPYPVEPGGGARAECFGGGPVR
jgi:hypothetical protein